MLRESDYNRLAASFHQVLQDYSCQEECQGLGMPEDTACTNFINYYKLVRIVLWRQALEYVLPKHARHIFKKFMAQLQQSLPEHQRKKQYGALMDTLGSISTLLQQDQGVVKLAQQCVTTFATTNSEDPAARVMRLTRQTLEHLQRTIEQLHSMRDQGFNDLSSALAVAFAPTEAVPPTVGAPEPAAAEHPGGPTIPVASEAPQLSPRAAALASEPLLIEPEDSDLPTFSAEDEVEELNDLATESAAAAPELLHDESPVVEMEAFQVVHGEAFVPFALDQSHAESVPHTAGGDSDSAHDDDEFEFVEDPDDDLAAAHASDEEPELIDLPIEVLDADPRQRDSRFAGDAASSASMPETSSQPDSPAGRPDHSTAAQAPAAIIIPLSAAVPELLDLPSPDEGDSPPMPARQDASVAVDERAGEVDASMEAEDNVGLDAGDDADGGEFNIILGDEDEEYALTLEDEDDGLEAEKIPAPPPESLFEISEPPPQHLSHGRITSSPPLETSSRARNARSSSRALVGSGPEPAHGTASLTTDAGLGPAHSANPAALNGRPGANGQPDVHGQPGTHGQPGAHGQSGAPASSAAPGRSGVAGKKASERRRHIRVNAEGLSVFINDTARQLPISNLSEHGLAVYHEGWAFAVEQVISLDLMTSYKVLMKDLHCRVIRCDAKLMACKFIDMDRQSQLLLRAIIKRLLQIRSKQAAGGGKSEQP